MSYFLLIWNPDLDQSWPTFVDNFRIGVETRSRFSCGVQKGIQTGDSVVMLRKGVEPRGVIGIGRVDDGWFQAPHWNPESSRELADYVRVEWEQVDTQPYIGQEDLRWSHFERIWHARSGGVRIDDAQGLVIFEEVRLVARGRELSQQAANAVLERKLLVEGQLMSRTASVRGRNISIRDHCLDHHKSVCKVCDFDPAKRFGTEFLGMIDVHHLDPLASSDRERTTDPIVDCVPLCANCHRLAHHGMKVGTCRSIEELKSLLEHCVSTT